MQVNKTLRTVGYAWLQNNTPPSSQELQRFCSQYFSVPGINKVEMVDFVIDSGKPKELGKRTGWKRILEAKAHGQIDMVCIPSMRLLSEYSPESLHIARQLAAEPNPVDVLFMYEGLISSSPEFETAMTFHLAMEDYLQSLRKKGKYMRKLYKEAQLSDVLRPQRILCNRQSMTV